MRLSTTPMVAAGTISGLLLAVTAYQGLAALSTPTTADLAARQAAAKAIAQQADVTKSHATPSPGPLLGPVLTPVPAPAEVPAPDPAPGAEHVREATGQEPTRSHQVAPHSTAQVANDPVPAEQRPRSPKAPHATSRTHDGPRTQTRHHEDHEDAREADHEDHEDHAVEPGDHEDHEDHEGWDD